MSEEYLKKHFIDQVKGSLNRWSGTGTGSSGVSSWNDLTDRPFGDNEDGTVTQLANKYLAPFEQTGGFVDLLPALTGTTSLNESFGVYQLDTVVTSEIYDKWNNNTNTVRVTYDGDVYDCTPQVLDGLVGAGNCAAFGGAGNNEPFVVGMVDEGNGSYYFICWVLTDSATAAHSVAVSIFDHSMYMLKDEYLPEGAGLPTITADADEGKFLRVVNGVGAWVTLSDVSQEGA